MIRRLRELDLSVSSSQPETPRDGNCMMHSLHDQLKFDPYQKSFAKSPEQLREKVLSYGYDMFIRTGKLEWQYSPELGLGSPEEWKERMSQDGEWGDEIFLCLAANVLSLDIVLVAAFRESSFLQGLGITIIKSLEKPRHKPVFLFCFSESDFQNPHYQSVRPNREENVLLTFLSSNTKTIDGSRSSILQESCVGSRLEMEDGSWTESIDNIEVLVSEDTITSYERYVYCTGIILFSTHTNINVSFSASENPVSILADQTEPSVTEQSEKRGPGRPPGSKNKPKQPSESVADQSDPAVPEQPKKRGRKKGSKNKPKRPCEVLANNRGNLAESLGRGLRRSRGNADQGQGRGQTVVRGRNRGRGNSDRGRGRGIGLNVPRSSEMSQSER